MPRKEGMKPIHILVTEENRDRINDYAKRRDFKTTADFIRHLIEQDMLVNGREEIDLGVDRGGYRERSESE